MKLNKPELSDLSTTFVSICLCFLQLWELPVTLALEMGIKLIIRKCHLRVND